MKIPLNSHLIWFFLWLGLIACLGIKLSYASPELPKQIAIIQMVEHPALNATRQGIQDALKNEPIQIKSQSAQNNNALATHIAKQFVGSSPNVLVGIGTIATQALLSADQHHLIPIVFSSVTDPKGSKLVQNLNHPEGIVTGVSNAVDPEIQFNLFKKILPKLTKIGIIYNPGETNSVTLVEQMKKVSIEKGLKMILSTANTTAGVVEATHKLISSKVEAIFINNDNTALSAFDPIVKISTEHKIPVFCSDTDMINRGALAALGSNQYEIGRQTGKMVLDILKGKKPSEIPVLFLDKAEARFNLAQALKLNIQIPKDLLP